MITKNELIESMKKRPLGFMYLILTIVIFCTWLFGSPGYQNLIVSFHEITPILFLAILAIIYLPDGE